MKKKRHVSSLVKKTNYDTKINELEKNLTDHDHITTPEFNTLAADVFNLTLAQANLITKTDLNAKLSGLNQKITSNESKHLLVENELKNIKTFDSSYFIGKSHFEEDGTQNYLVFQPINSILNELLMLVLAITFITGNLKDCLTKKLTLLKRLIIVLLQT